VAAGRRFHVAALPVEGGEVRLDAAAVRHASVLRLAPGDPVVLFDGRGAEASGEVVRRDGTGVGCRVGPPTQVGGFEEATCELLLGLPKAGKLDGVVRMVTEAGATSVRLVSCARTVGRADPERFAARMPRLARVATEAARQAGRADVPQLWPPEPVTRAAASLPPDAVRLVAHPGAAQRLVEVPLPAPNACVAVGPEGGFTDAELAALGDLGFVPVCLGPHVLRMETAAVVAVALAVARLRSR
jgi:16S rRNA (uracil1498-N3)-methyltransferase